MFSVVKNVTDFPNQKVDIPTLDYAFKSQQSLFSVTYLGCALYKDGRVEIQFDPDPNSSDLGMVDSIIASHSGDPYIVPIMYAPVTLLVGEKQITSDQTFEVVSSIFSRIESIVSDLSKGFAYVLGAYSCDPGTGSPEFSITYIPDGDNTEVELIPPSPLGDTAGKLIKFSASTPPGSCPTGYARYFLKARLNGGNSLTFADLTATPMELP